MSRRPFVTLDYLRDLMGRAVAEELLSDASANAIVEKCESYIDSINETDRKAREEEAQRTRCRIMAKRLMRETMGAIDLQQQQARARYVTAMADCDKRRAGARAAYRVACDMIDNTPAEHLDAILAEMQPTEEEGGEK